MSDQTAVEISVNGQEPIKTTVGQMAKAGRKLKTAPAPAAEPADTSGKRLKSFIERIERLETEKAGTAEDIKEVYAESKGVGFEPRIIRKLIKLRKMDVEKRREEEELEHLYMSAIGME